MFWTSRWTVRISRISGDVRQVWEGLDFAGAVPATQAATTTLETCLELWNVPSHELLIVNELVRSRQRNAIVCQSIWTITSHELFRSLLRKKTRMAAVVFVSSRSTLKMFGVGVLPMHTSGRAEDEFSNGIGEGWLLRFFSNGQFKVAVF